MAIMKRERRIAPSQRQLRVGTAIRHALVSVLARGHVHDPRIADAHLTITEVRVSPDLRNATVYFVPFGSSDGNVLVGALNQAAGFLRTEIAGQVRLRFAPSIRFEIDRTVAHASRIEELLRQPRVARDTANDEAADQEGKRGAHE
jgi:ribosome-binding factor A